MEHEEFSTNLAKLFNAAGYTEVKAEDVSEWMEGQDIGDASIVERAGQKLLGVKNYDMFDSLARLPCALERALDKSAPQYEGGIDLDYRVAE